MPEPKVLCIDSDSRACEWVRKMLTAAKVTQYITTVRTGEEALRLVKREPHDIVVMEYALPDITGVRLCISIRERLPGVPVVFFTALDRSVDRELAMAAGADEYLVKPNDLDLFVDTVIHLLRLREVNSSSTLWPRSRGRHEKDPADCFIKTPRTIQEKSLPTHSGR